MTDTSSSSSDRASADEAGGRSSALSTRPSSHTSLQTEHGTTTIAETVVTKIAALAAREVNGVADLGGSVSGALSNVVGRITGGSSDAPRTAGVGVEVGQTQAAVDLTIKVHYPASIHEVSDSVRQSVIDRIEGMTGLDVVEVNIAVVDLVFPGSDSGSDDQPRSNRVE